MVGQTGNTLTCDVSEVENLNSTITYQWTRYNGSISAQVRINSPTLSLSPLQLSHAGNYSCSINSTLLNNLVSADNNQRVLIQSKQWFYAIGVTILIICLIITVPDLQSVTITSSGMMVLRGSSVTLICSVQMNQTILASELSLLLVNASLIKPDGTVTALTLSTPMMSSTTLKFITQVNSFDDDDIGNYSCNVSVWPQSSFPYLTGMGQLESNAIEIVAIIGECDHDRSSSLALYSRGHCNLAPLFTFTDSRTSTGGPDSGAIAENMSFVTIVIPLAAIGVALAIFIIWFM